MKIAGFLLLATGWLLVLAAIILLGSAGARAAFVAAGLGTEALGFSLAVRSHLTRAVSRDPMASRSERA
jgi:small-conductance mechanosensitive channel